jgi:Rieske Fe-S protein
MPFEPSKPGPESTRRGMLVGVGLVGLAGTLTACGGSKDDDASSGDAKDSGGQSSGGGLGKTSDIPVGGGKVFKSEKVVVTQPTQGEFKAFSAVCTHRGCTVGSVSDGKIHCPCHGSAFSATDGSVATGPADKPLATKNVTVSNGELKLS